ncbi:uncharacterized protein [Rutidosis leptorrhynchoides]|uniref:uncharacterized protein n=1 Tax=Rutidosis leptorrhynchoides TaxID=125765 RepID=UPI003A9949D5
MQNYFKRKEPSSSTPINVVEIDDLPYDPYYRPRIFQYNPNQRDEIRRQYWIRGPSQPRGNDFPKTNGRRFVKAWFDKYSNWLEYSVKADRAFCLCCYLFGDQGGNEAFVTEGFNSWNKTERFKDHVGHINSFHNKALQKCDMLMRPNQSIHAAFHKQDDIVKTENRIRLGATVYACRYCLKCALPFRGHDETEASLFKGNFLELLDLIISQNEELRKLPKAPGNNKLVSPCIQKDVVKCFKQEVLKSIFKEIGDDVFALLVDESSDVSKKEQMAIVIRYVDTLGLVKERFVGLVHVKETSSLSLKSSIDSFFAKHKLSLKQLRGQGYDGASNMRGEFNGLKAKILEENSSAYYVHCFAHQLQLVVVAVARKHLALVNFFDKLAVLMNVVCASCKRKDILLDKEKERVEKEIGSGIIETGKGLNQELSLIRPGDTRWNSHYKTLLLLIDMYPSIIKVLEYVKEEGTNGSSQNQAHGLLKYLKSFDFVFYLHLMLRILGFTNILSQALQRKDQDILEAVSLVESTKERLQDLRITGFEQLLKKISSFCEKHDIEMLKMNVNCVNSRRQRDKITNQHYYEVECFNTIVDMQIQEFSDRFSEASNELLISMAALNPRNSFSMFDASKLMRLSKLYPNDFDSLEMIELEQQLDMYIHNVRKDPRFANLNGIGDLSRVMVETRKYLSFNLVYRLLKLALVLPVATATAERCFSAMKIVKSNLRNRIGDEFLNACVICAVEREALASVKDEDVIHRFQNMRFRKGKV